MRYPRKISAIGIFIVVSVFSSATWVFAHGGDVNLIHACVNPAGQVRIVGANDDCKGQETAVDWGIIGPAGPVGSQGEIGPTGPQGTAGADGVSRYQQVVSRGPFISCRQTSVRRSKPRS